MSSRIQQDSYNPTLESMIRKQIAWRDVTQDVGQANNTSFGRQDLHKTVGGPFSALIIFLRQVTEVESYRGLPVVAEV